MNSSFLQLSKAFNLASKALILLFFVLLRSSVFLTFPADNEIGKDFLEEELLEDELIWAFKVFDRTFSPFRPLVAASAET